MSSKTTVQPENSLIFFFFNRFEFDSRHIYDEANNICVQVGTSVVRFIINIKRLNFYTSVICNGFSK